MNAVVVAGIVVTILTVIPVVWQLGKHPRGLYILFFAEMWERFSYYGMRGLLIFYLTQHFLFDDATAQQGYATYTSLVYLMPLIGGYLADRYLGTRKAIAFGALLLVAGHFSMVFEGSPAKQILTYNGQTYEFSADGRMASREVRLIVNGERFEVGASPDGGMLIKGMPEGGALPQVLPKGEYQLSVADKDPTAVSILYMAMALIIMGVGFLKANISSIVGQLYEDNDPRRDPGFTLYYYGINLGAFWASILCGLLGETVGWYAGFGLAGFGMLLGYVVFVLGKPLLEGRGEPPEPQKLAAAVVGPLNTEWIIYLLALVGVAGIWYLLQLNTSVSYPLPVLDIEVSTLFLLLSAGSIGVLVYFVYHMLTEFTFVETQRVVLALVLISASVVFWALFEQAGSSLNQFAERNTVLKVGDVPITAAQTQSYNAGFILILAPIFSALWAYLGRRNADPRPAEKFGIALVQAGLGFLVLVWGAQTADENFKVAQIFLILAYLLHTTGELCISPVGLSQMTRLAPAMVISTVMATWFLASAWAQYVGGIIAQLTAAETVAGQVLDPKKALETYVTTFWDIGWIGIIIGGGLLLISPFLNFLAHEDKGKDGR
ncbi:MAG TPA: MFS transporter [Alphaproteobacteria bacterium]|nr:MFS transporter [Alphaproteobacteria bacterium]HAJ45106.1 MFS transporter [Alphaproteobacteria bacterium]